MATNTREYIAVKKKRRLCSCLLIFLRPHYFLRIINLFSVSSDLFLFGLVEYRYVLLHSRTNELNIYDRTPCWYRYRYHGQIQKNFVWKKSFYFIDYTVSFKIVVMNLFIIMDIFNTLNYFSYYGVFRVLAITRWN